MNTKLNSMQVTEVRAQLRQALESNETEQMRLAISAGLQLLEQFLPSEKSNTSLAAGSLLYTLEQEEYEPYGRLIDVRIDYDWSDYDPADDPSAGWGPSIADLQVVGVRYLNEEGEEVAASKHFQELAWELLEENHEEILEACTEHGYRNEVGAVPPTYCLQRSQTASQPRFTPRLAPSKATRCIEESRRQFG